MAEVQIQPCFLTPNKVQPEYPLFVFLPGMDGTGELLRSQTADLEVAFDVRCLAIPRDDLTSWDVLANKVLDLIHQELQINSQRAVYLCGESFGGCLAMKVAIAAPHLFKRIILINPASSFHRRGWLNWASQLPYLLPSWPCLFEIGALGLMPFIAALGRINRSDRQELLRTMRSVPPQTVLWRLSLIREFDVDEAKLRQLKQPVLLIASSDDRLLPSEMEARRLVDIVPNAKLVILPYSGHACLLEEGVKLSEICLANGFLESVEVVEEITGITAPLNPPQCEVEGMFSVS
jgi:pimeloyl-ACP methyl ester carboxylesterase